MINSSRHYLILIITCTCLLATSLAAPLLQAQTPTPLDVALTAAQVEVNIRGRSSTFIQPLVVMEVRNLTPNTLTLAVVPGTIWHNDQGNYCDLVVLRPDPSPIYFAGPADTPTSFQVYAYCLNPVTDARRFPSVEATYRPTSELASAGVVEVLDRIANEQGETTFAAQLAVWSAATGKQLAQLQQEMSADYSLYDGMVDKFLGLSPTPVPPVTVVLPATVPATDTSTSPPPIAIPTSPTESPDSTYLLVTIGGIILLAAAIFTAVMLKNATPTSAPVNTSTSSKSGQSASGHTAARVKPDPAVKRCVLCGRPMNSAGKCDNPDCSGIKGPISFRAGHESTEPIPVNIASEPAARSAAAAGRVKETMPPGEETYWPETQEPRQAPQQPLSHINTEPMVSTEHEATKPIRGQSASGPGGQVHLPTDTIRAQDQLTLKVVKGDQEGKEYILDGLQGIISRGKAEQITLTDDAKVSGPHAALAIYSTKPGGVDQIRDLWSKNGTLKNDERLLPNRWADLQDGDILQFGLTKLRYQQRQRQLVYLDGGHSPIALTGNNRWIITRNHLPFIDFESKDTSISVPHVYIRADGHLEVRDLSSGNGLYVQGRKIDGRALIFNEEVIQFGRETEIQIITTISNLPTSIGPWCRESWVGGGGMADVYRVRHQQNGQVRALKVPRPSKYHLNDREGAQYRSLFENEISVSKQVHHTHLVEAHEFDRLPNSDLPYLIMDYIDGPSVQVILEKLSQIRPADVAEIAVQVGLALQNLHEQHEYIHCDVKPNNILVDYTGRVFLTDLGVATRPGNKFSGFGVPKYLPPEVVAGGPVNPDTDVYSLGQTMYEMLTRQSLVTDAAAKHHEAISFPDTTKPIDLAELPATALIQTGAPIELTKVVQKCITDKRAARYPVMAELLAGIEPFRTGSNLKALVEATGWKPLTGSTR